jgi:uncharacterized membrane protein YhaH (DUF805 family)
MTFNNAVRSCLRKFTTFSGRSPRSEYWKFVLFIFLCLIALIVLNSLIFGPDLKSTIRVSQDASGKVIQTVSQKLVYSDGWLGDILFLVTLLPLLAVTWRRMHDISRPGWHILVPFPVACCIAYAAFALAPKKFLPIETSSFGPDYSGPTEISFPLLPTWLMIAIWVLGMAAIVLSIYWLARKPQPGPNQYGPNPLEVTP